jgi:metallo-beta-lactamase class B
MKLRILLLFTLGGAALSLSAQMPAEWTTPIEPARVIGTIHYVGSADLGSYLIDTGDGLMLLDVPLEENVPMILGNVRKLGFDPAEIKVILNSHAHFDHSGGIASVKKLTGAKVYLSAADAELAARGGRDDFAFGDRGPYAPFDADEILEDGEVVRLGNVEMTAVLTPGHTKGCTTWKTSVPHEGERLDVLFLCSVTAPGYRLAGNEKYPEIFEDYRKSFAKLGKLDADVFLANHGSFFGLTRKLAEARKGGANPFVARGELHAYLDRAWKELADRKNAQERAARTSSE